MKPVKLKALEENHFFECLQLDRFHADISGRLIPITVRPNSAGGVRRTSLPGKQKMRVRVPPGARVLIATRHPSNNLPDL
ncbi:unnamed protein product [Heligmosomoides polygyrus]|uniref:Major sperm protein n=1 Tax=Heligmosomoides polygyrus TaxID=6339 RepID=A0A183FPJ7_HELPZ|nr:unnamed protein product [Heligmosomoides polygyrus]